MQGLAWRRLQVADAQLLDLFHRLVDWRRIPGMWWPLVVSFWLVFDVSMAGLAVLLGVTDSPLDVNWSLFFDPGLLLFLLLLSFEFPAVEEVGLRGYYTGYAATTTGPGCCGRGQRGGNLFVALFLIAHWQKTTVSDTDIKPKPLE